MLIITATNESQWLRSDTGESEGSHLYGPVLRKDILSQVSILTLVANIPCWLSSIVSAKDLTLSLWFAI